MLLPIDALRLTRKNMKERQGRLEGYFHTIHEKPHLAPALLLNTGQVCAHSTTFDKITSCSYFYFPNEVKLFKWSITFLNPPEDGRNAAPCHSGLQDGLPHQQRPWAISRPLETIHWVRSQIRKYWPRDSKRSVKDGASEDITNDSRMSPRRRVWLKYWKPWQGSDCHPCQSRQSPEIHGPHQYGLHSDILAFPTVHTES